MEAYLAWLQNGVAAIGVWFIVPFLLLENIPIVGLFAPGLTVLVLSGFFHNLLVSHVAVLYGLAWLVIVGADNFWFWLGYYGQNRSRWLARLVARAPNVADLLRQQPWYMLVTYQFIPYFRMFLPLALGAYRFSPWRWFTITLVASGLYVGVFLTIGVVGAKVASSIVEIDAITNSLNTFLAAFAIAYGLVLWRQYHKLKKA